MAVVWQPASDYCISKPLAACYPDALLVKERTFPALGNEHFLICGIVDQARDNGVFALECN